MLQRDHQNNDFPALKTFLVLMFFTALFLTPAISYSRAYKGVYYRGTLVSLELNSRTRARDVNWSEEVGPHRYGQLKTRTSTVESFTIIVDYGGKIYTGSYSPDFFRRYRPTEWQKGDPIEFRLTPGYIYFKRPNGREFKAQYIASDNDS